MRIIQGAAFRFIAMNTGDIILIYSYLSIWKKYLSCWDEILDDFGPLPNSRPAAQFPTTCGRTCQRYRAERVVQGMVGIIAGRAVIITST